MAQELDADEIVLERDPSKLGRLKGYDGISFPTVSVQEEPPFFLPIIGKIILHSNEEKIRKRQERASTFCKINF